MVVGHTDNQPIRTVRFPSNFQLSAARAQGAKDIIATATGRARALHVRRARQFGTDRPEHDARGPRGKPPHRSHPQYREAR